jgi:hypothetical protein
MYKRTSTPSKKGLYPLGLISLKSKKKSIGIQTDIIELNDILIQGKNMNDDEFEKFIQGNLNKIFESY